MKPTKHQLRTQILELNPHVRLSASMSHGELTDLLAQTEERKRHNVHLKALDDATGVERGRDYDYVADALVDMEWALANTFPRMVRIRDDFRQIKELAGHFVSLRKLRDSATQLSDGRLVNRADIEDALNALLRYIEVVDLDVLSLPNLDSLRAVYAARGFDVTVTRRADDVDDD